MKRFWDKVDIRGPDECWLWTRGRHSHGYGVYYLEDGRQVLSHRMALTLSSIGAPGLHALHSCDNPPCCNPAHLHWGTHAENMREAAERGLSKAGRSNLEVCTNGHSLTGDNVRTGVKVHKGKSYKTRICRQCQRETQRARRALKKGS